MSNNTTIKYLETRAGTKYHIASSSGTGLTLCGIKGTPDTVSIYYTPMRADICKTCSRIHNKQR